VPRDGKPLRERPIVRPREPSPRRRRTRRSSSRSRSSSSDSSNGRAAANELTQRASSNWGSVPWIASFCRSDQVTRVTRKRQTRRPLVPTIHPCLSLSKCIESQLQQFNSSPHYHGGIHRRHRAQASFTWLPTMKPSKFYCLQWVGWNSSRHGGLGMCGIAEDYSGWDASMGMISATGTYLMQKMQGGNTAILRCVDATCQSWPCSPPPNCSFGNTPRRLRVLYCWFLWSELSGRSWIARRSGKHITEQKWLYCVITDMVVYVK
jgi:hypothetical protein